VLGARGPKGTLETFAIDRYTAEEQAAERGTEELCAKSYGTGSMFLVPVEMSTSGRPDVDCKEQ